MGKQLLPGIIGLCLLSQGCSMCKSLCRNLVHAPLAYNDHADKYVTSKMNYLWADAVWKETQACAPCHYSQHFAQGFRDGFADHLNFGGKGEPPPVPPRRYWKLPYQTPQGHEAVQDWYAGFRTGASVAMEGNYRAWVTVPPSMPCESVVSPPVAVRATPSVGQRNRGTRELETTRALPKPDQAAPATPPRASEEISVSEFASDPSVTDTPSDSENSPLAPSSVPESETAETTTLLLSPYLREGQLAPAAQEEVNLAPSEDTTPPQNPG